MNGNKGSGYDDFSNCSSLKRVTVLGTVENFNTGAFSETPVETVIFQDGVKVIGENAFNTCGYLSTLVFPVTLERIEDYAFNTCSQLEEISLPLSLTYIGSESFAGTGITSVVIPENCTFGGDPFNYCAVTELTLPKVPKSYCDYYDWNDEIWAGLEYLRFTGSANEWVEYFETVDTWEDWVEYYDFDGTATFGYSY